MRAPGQVGARLRAARRAAGLSQEALAERSGISVRRLRDLERGLGGTPRSSTLTALATALAVSVDDLTATAAPAWAAPADDGGPWPDLLRRHRVALGLTQRDLGRAALLSERTVSDLERGLARPRAVSARLLADALRLEASERTAFLATAARGADGAEPAALELPDGLPTRYPTPLLGRDGDVEAILAALADPGVVTVTGPGGVGKTRCALAVAQRLVAGGRRVRVVALAAVARPSDVRLAVAFALGITDVPDADVDGAVGQRLADLDVLLLDNVEHLLAATPTFLAYSRQAPRLGLLVTGRGPLRVAGEREHRLRPLPLVVTPAGGPQAPDGGVPAAVALFEAAAAVSVPGWAARGGDVARIARICERLDGLPLAIELAAGWVRLMTTEQVLERLDRPLRLLRGGRRDLAERHQALEATIAHSVDLVSEGAARLFAQLSVLGAGVTLDLAEAVAGPHADDAAAELAELLDAGLLDAQPGGGGPARLGWLSVVREHAAQRLDGVERRAVRARYCSAVAGVAREAADRLVGPDQGTWLQRLSALHAHLRAVLDLLLDDDPAAAVDLAADLWRYWYLCGHYTEGVDRLRAALAAAEALGNPRTATVRYGLAVLTYLQGDAAFAQEHLTLALAEFRRLGDAHGESSSLTGLGLVAQFRGDGEAARTLFLSARDVALAGGRARALAVALANLASLARDTGELEAAVHWGEEARATFTGLGDRSGTADAMSNLADVQRQLGRQEVARAAAIEAYALFDDLENEAGLADVGRFLSRLAVESGDESAARRWVEEAGRRCAALGDRWGSASCEEVLGLLGGDAPRVEAALDSQRALEHEQGVVEALLSCAEVALRHADPALALSRLAEVAHRSAVSPLATRQAALLVAQALAPSRPAGAAAVLAHLTPLADLLPAAHRLRYDEVAAALGGVSGDAADVPAPLRSVVDLVQRRGGRPVGSPAAG